MEKIGKIDFFAIFFTFGSPKNESVEYSTGPEYVVEYSEGSKHIRTLSEKISHLLNPPSLRRVHFVVWPGLP